jgi:C-methyltransferase C-terminal domain/Putative zinc binding domain
MACRACAAKSGDLVLDLGPQPVCDQFSVFDDRTRDAVAPLRMWLCSSCGLAQLVGAATAAAEPRGTEPAVLVAQARDAVNDLAGAGWLPAGGRVVEFPSPHGGSWLDCLAAQGVTPAGRDQQADLVVDSFGMMHEADQAAAVAERAARVAPGGALALQYHSLNTIMRLGQWNALRHGHFAYYSTSTLTGMLEREGFFARVAWQFDLYGGTVMLVASRHREPGLPPESSVHELLSDDERLGVRRPASVGRLQEDAESHACGLREWLVDQRSSGRSVLGYGAASRAVALLCKAGVDRRLLPAIVDSSPAKHHRRMPGTDIPIVDPGILGERPPHAVLLFVPDLMTEVRHAYPAIEASGGTWVDADGLRS